MMLPASFAALVAFLAFLAGFAPVSLSLAATAVTALVAGFVVALSATSSLSCGPRRRARSLAAFWASIFFSASLLCSASAASWNPDLCVRPTGVGASSGGAPFTILGSAGSSVRTLRLYRNNGNDGYLRGVVAVFTDGTEMRAGVRKDQFSEITLSEGEIITSATLWSFTPSGRKAKSSSARVGRIDITTDRRSWGYGVDNTAKLSSKAVNVGSGVLVGLQGSTGDDMDSVALIFLKTMSNSVVDDIVFEKPASNNGLSLVTLKEGSAVHKGTDFSYTFSGSESRDASTTFSTGSSTGLSLKTTFHAALPQILDSGIDAGMDIGSTQSYDHHNGRSAELSWSTTVALTKDNPAVSCSAMVWMGKVEVGWHGTQTITADGSSVSFPVSGTLTHVAYGKVETVCKPLAAPSSSSYSSASSSSSAAKVAKTWTA